MDGAQRTRGCLLGGAVGDAMGAVVEFLSLREIRSRFGDEGLVGYPEDDLGAGQFTDDTQMTIFTLEGLIRASVRGRTRGSVTRPRTRLSPWSPTGSFRDRPESPSW
jgi:ADP-ribosylglycohydrolase